MAFIAAGAAFLPACNNIDSAPVTLKNIAVSNQQQQMLAVLAQTILPATDDLPGAKELKSHEFLLLMIDDCSLPGDQLKFTNGIIAFDEFCHAQFGQLFTGFTRQQRASLLTGIELKKNVPATVLHFYTTVKRYTLQSFTSCRPYMLKVKNYKMIPGTDFMGCVNV